MLLLSLMRPLRGIINKQELNYLSVPAATPFRIAAASSALIAPSVLKSATALSRVSTVPSAAGEYVVEIKVDGEFPLVSDLAATQFTVEASDNLTLASFTKTSTGMAEFNEERMSFTYANSEAPADGTVLLSLVFTVDAAAAATAVKDRTAAAAPRDKIFFILFSSMIL